MKQFIYNVSVRFATVAASAGLLFALMPDLSFQLFTIIFGAL